MRYRYHFSSGDFLLGGTGTGESGTDTTWPLLKFCFGVLVPVCLVSVPLPLHLFPNRGIEGYYLDQGEFPPLEPHHKSLELH